MDTASAAFPKSLFGGSHTQVGQTHAARSAFWVIFAALAAVGFFTPNGLITSAALITLPLLGFLLWRVGEPPVLLFGCVFQWLQATAAIFYTNHNGMTLEEAFGSNELAVASWLSIAAVVVLAIGIRLGLINAGAPLRAELESEASKIDHRKVAIIYVVAFVVATVLNKLAWYVTAITQILLTAAALKWAVVFLLFYIVIHQRRGYGVLVGCIVLEFISGLLGIYADFKSVFFVLVIATMSFPMALRGRRLATITTCFAVLFVLGVVWSSIKMDYRAFLTEETSGPDDAIPIERKFDKMADLLENVTWENLEEGIDFLILRVSYVNFFALTIENVPNRVPFENGELWKGAAAHVLMPRFLFPDKPALDDSERTRLYTGMNVAGSESGTSIGIGYVGESYIDFGPIWMFVPIFLLGILYGVIYRCFVTRTKYKLLGSALAVSILIFNAYEIEISNIKLLGGVIAATLVSVSVYKAFGFTLARFLRQAPAQMRSVWSAVVDQRF